MLADGLRACQLCCHLLHLKDCVGEKKFGLGHILLVKCGHDGCSLINEIPTGSRHKTHAGGIAWDVNTKLVAGRSNIFNKTSNVMLIFVVLYVTNIMVTNQTIDYRNDRCRTR